MGLQPDLDERGTLRAGNHKAPRRVHQGNSTDPTRRSPAMPIVLWLLGVPLSLVLILLLVGVI